jgi:hypothetical protein
MAAERLRLLLPEIVFVGGCATGLLIDDPGAARVRGTYDVDVIAEIASYAEYTVFSERLRALGFQEDTSEGAPLCRWRHGGLILDVMPLDPKILGFSNRWYSEALRAAEEVRLPAGSTIRAITASYFLGTKLEAFRGRGRDDYFSSHDLEDFMAVVGRKVISFRRNGRGLTGTAGLRGRSGANAVGRIALSGCASRLSSPRRGKSGTYWTACGKASQAKRTRVTLKPEKAARPITEAH